MCADNVTADPGTGGSTFATDEDGSSIHHPYVKLEWGAADTFTKVDTGAGSLPAQGAAAENAAAAGNPVLTGGRYDSSARTLGDGDAGAFALSASGHVIVDTLPAGTNAIGKLAANSGVDIGDVDVTSVVPGTGATNLGKAIDTAVGSTDTGIALLAKHREDQVHLTTADGYYDVLTLDSLGSLHVNAEAHHIFDQLDSTSGWTVLGNDTANLNTTSKHVMGTFALTFDKVDGAANTAIAGIQKTLSSTDLGDVSPHDILQGSFYLSDLTDVSYVFLRLGTDSANYNEWRLDSSLLTAGIFETGALTIGDADYDGILGTGMDSSAITYIAVGVAFNAETDTLAGIIFDQVSYHTNQHTSTSINSEVSSSVSSANVNINKVGNKVVNTGAGAVGTGTQRITIANDDALLTTINTAVELIDDAIYVDDADWTATTSKHMLSGGVYSATPRTVTDGDTAPLAIDLNGHLITSAHAASVALGDNVSNTANILVDEADAFMVSATFGYMYDSSGGNWDRLRGDATDGLLVNLGSNNDVTVTGDALTALQLIDNTVYVDDADWTALTSSHNLVGGVYQSSPGSITDGDTGPLRLNVNGAAHTELTVALPAGTNAIGKLAANSGVDIGDVDVTSISAGSNLIGDVGLSGARTSGGTTLYKNIDVDESEDQVKGTAGQVYWIHAVNMTATPVYLKLYNATAATVVVGTTTPDLTFPVPSSGDTSGAGFTLSIPNGIEFGTAITIAATTGVADADTGAPAANALIVNLGYA